ncbi:MAG TPA: SpoIID/LytB domain-containing protein [Longimicrobiales bacterium]|nr:SpoIID/LytB domain-containing protein [Longimicrobiales bacterium]
MVLILTVVAAACRPGEAPRDVPSPGAVGSMTMPQVRVGLEVAADSVIVGSTTGWTLERANGDVSLSARADETWTVRADAGREVVAYSAGRSIGGAGAIRVTPAAGGHVRVGDRTYRGTVLLIAGGGGVTAINVLDLETYLLGVVPREIGARPETEIEAVKAQAVAARTYAIANLGGRASLGFDYHAGTQDQVYGGILDEEAVATRAVRETRGQIATFDGVPILAYYSSTCGGRTAAIEDSWPGRSPVRYLKSVSDRIPGTDNYYCEPSNRFRWTVEWNRAQLLSTLGETLRAYTGSSTLAPPGRIRSVAMDTNASGRATVRVATGATDFTLRMDSIRWILRTPAGAALNSSALDSIHTTIGIDGDVEELSVHGGGWGHAVGMCQFGAIGRARAGQKLEQILVTYYPGTELTRVY